MSLQVLKDQELMTEGQNIRVESSTGPETLPNRMEQRENDREHVAGNLAASSRKFNWLNQYGVFG